MKDRKNTFYHILYGIMLISIISMVVMAFTQYDGPSTIEECFPETIDFSEGWIDETGAEVNTSKLHNIEGVKAGTEFSIFHDIPEDLEEGQYLCFRSKNIFLKVYIDGNLVYEPYTHENVLYTKSSGTRWNYFPISKDKAGCQIEFRITMAYSSGRASLDNISIGEPTKSVMDAVGDKIVAFITCILLIFVGIILIIVDIPINLSTRKNHELLYLGLFALSIATWCLAETHLLQFYVGNSRIVQLITCSSLMLIPIPLTLYLDAAFGFKKRIVVYGMVGLSFSEFIICMFMHFKGLADIHETLTFTHVLLILSALLLLYTIIKNSFVMGKSSTRNVYKVLRGIGLTSISFATAIDIFRFYQGSSNDTAMFVRIGLLIFILCYGSSSLEKTINAVKLGVQTEFVSQLAYKDGLTGTGNRTAFEERLVELEKTKDTIGKVGIIMFDVNDLKYVNDNLGHPEGDKLLLESAALIKDTFSKIGGNCFRIGGDEFVIVLSGENVSEECEEGLELFKAAMKSHNAKPNLDLRISIASGYAIYGENQTGKKLMDIYHEADIQMYENKKKMKASQIPPAEYYKNRTAKS